MFPRFILRLLTWIFLVSMAAPCSPAAEVTAAPVVTMLSPTSVVVRWRTDVPTGTRVTYGLTAERLNHSAEGGLTDAHEVTLSGLQPGTKYFFAAGTARKTLAAGQFTTSSSPVSGQAPPSKSPATASPATPKPKSLLARIFAPILPPDAAESNAGAHQGERATSWPRLRRLARRGGSSRACRIISSATARISRATSADDYAAQAWRFRQRARTGALRVKVDEDGVQRVSIRRRAPLRPTTAMGRRRRFLSRAARDISNASRGAR